MKTLCIDKMAEAIAASAAQLKEKADSHNKLIAEAFGIDDLDDTADGSADRLRQGLYETVEALEEVRETFKSKRLDELRKKLMRILMDT